jgi:hypothetical protein
MKNCARRSAEKRCNDERCLRTKDKMINDAKAEANARKKMIAQAKPY